MCIADSITNRSVRDDPALFFSKRQVSIQRAPGEPEQLADVGHGVLLAVVKLEEQLLLGRTELLAATTVSAAGSGGLKAGHGALSNQAALELSQRSEDLEYQPAARGRGVNRLLQAPEPNSSILESLNCLDQVLERPPQAIQSPDNERVTRPQVRESQIKPRTIGLCS